MTYIAYYYIGQSGQSPLEKYLETIKNKPTLAKIYRLICKFIDANCNLPSEFTKHVTGKIYELRLRSKNNQYRVFYFIAQKEKIILLDGYTKKTKKIPKHILKRITNHYKNYLITQNAKPFIKI